MSVILALLLQTGKVPATESFIRGFDLRFDGWAIRGLVVVCAGDRPLYVSPDLKDSAFQIIGAFACDSGERTPYRSYDYGPSRSRPYEVAPGTCAGAYTTLPVVSELDPPTPRCLDVDVSATTFSKKGASVGLLKTRIRVHVESATTVP